MGTTALNKPFASGDRHVVLSGFLSSWAGSGKAF